MKVERRDWMIECYSWMEEVHEMTKKKKFVTEMPSDPLVVTGPPGDLLVVTPEGEILLGKDHTPLELVLDCLKSAVRAVEMIRDCYTLPQIEPDAEKYEDVSVDEALAVAEGALRASKEAFPEETDDETKQA